MNQIDIYVIDNASNDGSVEELKDRFKDQIFIIENKENLGGSGGFNTGLRLGLKKDYDYLVLADNDVVMAEDAIECLYRYMKENPSVGLCGAKIMEKQSPHIIQEMGGTLQLSQFRIISYFQRAIDNESIPKELECDFVSACTLMANGSALKKIGVMDDEFYIYMDDIEWSIRVKQAGYKIAVCGDAKVWHEKQAVNAMPTNTFARYYLWRNKIHLFSKYVEENELGELTDNILRNTFNIIYGNEYKHYYEENKSVIYALEDFIHGVRGKAQEHKILPINYSYDPFRQVIQGNQRIRIYFDGDRSFHESKRSYEALNKVLNRIKEIDPGTKILISVENPEEESEILSRSKEILQTYTDMCIETERQATVDLELKLCGHCNWVTENILPVMYIDERFNCIRNQEDYEYFINYEQEYSKFRAHYYDALTNGMHRVRGDNKAGEKL
jgi:Predicted glycosyltransferases